MKEHQAEQAEEEDPQREAAVATAAEVEEDERAAGQRDDLQHEHEHLEAINDAVRGTYRRVPAPAPGEPGLGPQASQRALTREELAPLSLAELRLIRNEVFARHGYTFKSPDLQAYFGAKPWYRPDPAYTEERLTPIERQNVRLLKELEAARK